MSIVYTGLNAGSRSFQLAAVQPDRTIIFNRRFLMNEANLRTAFTSLRAFLLQSCEVLPGVKL